MSDAGHMPVLIDRVLAVLAPQQGMVCLDCTVGRAGHAVAITRQLVPHGRYIAIDLDSENVSHAKEQLAGATIRVDVVHANFAEAPKVLKRLGIDRVDLLLADLGFASTQMVQADRGFSFNLDGPLDMRMDPTRQGTAADLLSKLSCNELADLIYTYGEERLSRKIAKKIVEYRRSTPILTTWQLARIVRQAYGSAHRKWPRQGQRRRRRVAVRIDPATRTFMALRIAVNNELESLQCLLDALPELIRPGGRAAIISFHSLEDRRVKQAFTALRRDGRARWLSAKPLVADRDERHANPRSRSAKLRAIQLIKDPQCTQVDG